MTCVLSQTSIGFRNPADKTPLTAYRLPSWGYQHIRLIGGSQGRGQKEDDAKIQSYGVLHSANGIYSFLRSSDAERLVVSGRLGSSHEVDKGYGFSFDDDDEFDNARRFAANTSLDTEYDRYFKNKLHLGGSVRVHNDYSNNLEYVLTDDKSDWKKGRTDKQNGFGGSFALAVGIGRIRDVNPVIHALRFRERFAELGLAPELTDAQVQEVAGLFSQYSGYDFIYDRQDKYFWDTLYKTVGVEALTPFQMYYLRESFGESIGYRREGWQLDLAGTIGVHHYESSLQDYSRLVHQKIGLSFQWSKNLNLNHQLSAHFYPGYSRQQVSDYVEYGRNIQADVEHLWVVADRVLLTSGAEITLDDSKLKYAARLNADNRTFEYDLYNVYSEFSFFIEDFLALSLPISIGKRDADWSWHASCNLTWYVDRSLR
jgi:hypothetical protein